MKKGKLLSAEAAEIGESLQIHRFYDVRNICIAIDALILNE